MLYTFYSVARREHVVGLWRGLVPVSMSRMFLRLPCPAKVCGLRGSLHGGW